MSPTALLMNAPSPLAGEGYAASSRKPARVRGMVPHIQL
jgi:hypothetical protein